MEGLKHITGQALARHHRPEIATLDDPSAPWIANFAAPVHALGSKRAVYGYSKNLDKWLLENLSRFDRVVVHGVWQYLSYSVWKATRRIPKPFCLFTHGFLDPWFQKHYPLKHIKKVLYWRAIEHRVVRDAQAVLFTSEEEMRLADGSFRPYQCHPRVVGYGIPPVPQAKQDRDEVIRELTASHPQLKGRRFFLFLARIHEKKGIDLLLQAFAKVKERLPNTAIVIAGKGDPELVKKLHSLASSLSITSDLVWTGAIYGEFKWSLIKAAEAYILPSHQENFGISVVEALACGTPVLISNKVNIWREIQAAGAGIVKNDDVNGTAELLNAWAMLTPQEKGTMKVHAEACWDRNFNIVKTSGRFFDILMES